MTVAINQPVIAYDAAAAMVAAAMEHARARGWAIAAIVLDPAGHVVASGRMDGVSPLIMDIAADKALTATLGKSSQAYFERMSSEPSLTMGAANRPRLCAWEGGVPIHADEALLGAIGVSGAAGPEDVACAEAALVAVLGH